MSGTFVPKGPGGKDGMDGLGGKDGPDGLDLDDITWRALRAGHFAGAVIRIERNGIPLHEKAWGFALDTPRAQFQMTTDCLFDLASISKIFTTTVILRLVTTRNLRLDDRLKTILGYSGTRLGKLLGCADVRAALTHATGIHYWYPFYVRRGMPALSLRF